MDRPATDECEIGCDRGNVVDACKHVVGEHGDVGQHARDQPPATVLVQSPIYPSSPPPNRPID